MQSPNSRKRIVPLRLRQQPRRRRNLPCAGNPYNLHVALGRAAAMQTIQRSLRQGANPTMTLVAKSADADKEPTLVREVIL
jgi:hypothetical protein